MEYFKVDIEQLTPKQIDWFVAKYLGKAISKVHLCDENEEWVTPRSIEAGGGEELWVPSLLWEQAGPIIADNKLDVCYDTCNKWGARSRYGEGCSGETPQIAAMRCYILMMNADKRTIKLPYLLTNIPE